LPACYITVTSHCLNKPRLLAFALLVCLPFNSWAAPEESFETTSETSESPEVYEVLENLRAHPLDLNSAGVDRLADLPWISPAMATKLVAYREENGPFKSIGDLAGVQGFSSIVVERLSPYVFVGKPRLELERKYRLRSRFGDKRPRVAGYDGSSFRLYNRVSASVGGSLSACALTEKDPYEERFADMLTGHAHLGRAGILGSVVAGDFWLDFAENLVLGRSRYMMKGSGVAKGRDRGIIPNSSSVESGWLRGVAGKITLWDPGTHWFWSHRRLDAKVNADGMVTVVYQDGLHRSQSEIANIGRLGETIFGGRAALHSGFFRAGLTGFRAEYDIPFAGSNGDLFSFEGKSYGVVGTDMGVSVGPAELFCELATSLSLGEGYLFGFSYKEKGADLGLLYRHYDEDFYNPHSSGFSGGEDCNEEGAYLEVTCKPTAELRLSGYMDLFRTLGPSRGSIYGSYGRDVRLEAEQKLSRKVKLVGRLYAKGKEESFGDEGVRFEERRGWRLQADLNVSRSSMMRARFEAVFAGREGDPNVDKGSLFFCEVAFGPAEWVRIRSRFAVFQTDSWDARLYQHESDLPGVMRNSAINGRGAMGYVLGSVRAIQGLKVSGKVTWKRKDGELERSLALQTDLEIERN
jgi:hypothetical protein